MGISTTIQLKRGTKQQWESANPILKDGELGVERNTGKLKLGDSVTPWNDLAYFYDPEELGGMKPKDIDTSELSDDDTKVPSSKLVAQLLSELPSGGGGGNAEYEEAAFRRSLRSWTQHAAPIATGDVQSGCLTYIKNLDKFMLVVGSKTFNSVYSFLNTEANSALYKLSLSIKNSYNATFFPAVFCSGFYNGNGALAIWGREGTGVYKLTFIGTDFSEVSVVQVTFAVAENVVNVFYNETLNELIVTTYNAQAANGNKAKFLIFTDANSAYTTKYLANLDSQINNMSFGSSFIFADADTNLILTSSINTNAPPGSAMFLKSIDGGRNWSAEGSKARTAQGLWYATWVESWGKYIAIGRDLSEDSIEPASLLRMYSSEDMNNWTAITNEASPVVSAWYSQFLEQLDVLAFVDRRGGIVFLHRDLTFTVGFFSKTIYSLACDKHGVISAISETNELVTCAPLIPSRLFPSHTGNA